MKLAALIFVVGWAISYGLASFALGAGGNMLLHVGSSANGGGAPLTNLRITDTGDFRVTNTGDNRAVSP